MSKYVKGIQSMGNLGNAVHSPPPMARSNIGNRLLVARKVKDRSRGKNPSIAICEANTDIRAMLERKGFKKCL